MISAIFQNEPPLFQSSDIDQTIQRFAELLWPHRMHVNRAGRIDSYFTGFNGRKFALICLRYGANVSIDAGNMDDIFLVQHKLSGKGYFKNGNYSVDTVAGTTTIASPSLPTSLQMDEDSIHVVVKLNRQEVEGFLQDCLQRMITEPLVFEPVVKDGGTAASAWTRSLEYFWYQYRELKHIKGMDFDRMFSQSAIAQLLFSQPHNYSSFLRDDNRACAPIYVRRAQEYIHANITDRIYMSELTSLTGVTSRTLQIGFQHHLGQSPLEYIHTVRLERVHQQLLKAERNEKVTDILVQNGVFDCGRFAGRYRKKYGCSPSYTLKYRTN